MQKLLEKKKKRKKSLTYRDDAEWITLLNYGSLHGFHMQHPGCLMHTCLQNVVATLLRYEVLKAPSTC